MNLSILYRGPLSSCNYACDYCPFAKHSETPTELAHDRACLERFVGWVRARTTDTIGVLFTPWGEALVRKWYQAALAELTQMPNVSKAAIQTNISCKLDWVEACDKTKLALWCTFHPSETTRTQFLGKCRELLARGVRFSVGVVGLKEHLAEIEALRQELPPEVYLWVNAYKRGRNAAAAGSVGLGFTVAPLPGQRGPTPPSPLPEQEGVAGGTRGGSPLTDGSGGRSETTSPERGNWEDELRSPVTVADSVEVPRACPPLPSVRGNPPRVPPATPSCSGRGDGWVGPTSADQGTPVKLTVTNAAQETAPEPSYYTPEMLADLTRIDPLFPLNNTYHRSRGEPCRAGSTAISVDGDGTVRRCHFIKGPIGNIYDPDFASCLRERLCTNDSCGCHIGYVHLDRLKLYDTFGSGVLERVPLGYR